MSVLRLGLVLTLGHAWAKDVCEALYQTYKDKWKQKGTHKVESIFKQRDLQGNTAFHMAVLHDKKDIFDWLKRVEDTDDAGALPELTAMPGPEPNDAGCCWAMQRLVPPVLSQTPECAFRGHTVIGNAS
eukprot:917134-Rhodomonas_salina.2